MVFEYFCFFFFFFKQKTAYEMRISDWSSDVCSSDLGNRILLSIHDMKPIHPNASTASRQAQRAIDGACSRDAARLHGLLRRWQARSEEHTSELQSLMRISYAVFCLKKKKKHTTSTLKTQRI